MANANRTIEPRMLTKDQAAAYCGLSVATFIGRYPYPPVNMGNSDDYRLLRYDRRALDAWLDGVTGIDDLLTGPSMAEQMRRNQRRRRAKAQGTPLAAVDDPTL